MITWRFHPDIEALARKEDTRGLIALLSHHDFTVQWRAAEALGDLGEHAIPDLRRALRSHNVDVCIGAIEALGDIRSPDAVEDLISLLSSQKIEEVRWAAALALGETGDTRAIAPLVDLLRDHSKYVRYGAARALEKLKWDPVNVEEKAAHAVSLQDWERIPFLGEGAIPSLLYALTDHDPRVRAKIVEMLGIMESPLATPACDTALVDMNEGVRWRAWLNFPRCGLSFMHLTRGLHHRPRMGNKPYVAALLNLLFLGMGYNYLGKWWGVLLFQINLSLIVLLSLMMGPILPYLLSYSVSAIFSVHAWHLAKGMPDI
jgi:HEAT repeat protein